MSNNFAKVYGWGCAFRKGVKTSKRGKIAWWGKTNEFYTLRQKVGIILSDNFCHVVFWFRPHACGSRMLSTKGEVIEILEFTHFARIFKFNTTPGIGRKKEISHGIKVSVVMELV